MPLSALSLAVVGVIHPNAKGPTRRFAIDLCRPGDPVQLIPEPKNPADQNAIMILNGDGMQMGYVPADKTWLIHRAWRDAREVNAVFQGAVEAGAWIRVAFDEEPTLPPQSFPRAPKPAEEPDFYPDEIFPDE